MLGIKGQDLVVLFKLVSLEEAEWDRRAEGHEPWGDALWSVRALEHQTGISKTEINAAIRRCFALELAVRDRESGRPRPNRRYLADFVAYGLKFVFPAEVGALDRGMPTAFDAPMLSGDLMTGQYPYVWPTPDGQVLGQGVKPLFRSVPQAARNDDRLYEYLALVDAIRLGNPREAGLARERLAAALHR